MTVPEGTNVKNPPQDAATVILTRDNSDGQYEVFLMRRHQNQAFMGGVHVFPGGRLDEADCDPVLVHHTRGLSVSEASQLLQEADLPGDRALGLFLAAIRETLKRRASSFPVVSMVPIRKWRIASPGTAMPSIGERSLSGNWPSRRISVSTWSSSCPMPTGLPRRSTRRGSIPGSFWRDFPRGRHPSMTAWNLRNHGG